MTSSDGTGGQRIIREVLWEGRRIRFTWIPGGDMDAYRAWSQVYGFCFTRDGKLLIVKDRYWILPGGAREEGETPEMTLRREVLEEASTTLSTCGFLGAQEVHDPDQTRPRPYEVGGHHFQLRFAAIIDEMLPQGIDPASGVRYERKLIDPAEFSAHIPWGDAGEAMVRSALAWFRGQHGHQTR